MAERRLKVVQLLPALQGGGVERGTLEVAEALVAAGHDSIVISAGGRLVTNLERAGSRHLHLDLGRKSLTTLLRLPQLRRWLRRERPDILHLRSRLPAWMAWLVWRSLPQADRPHLVTTVHGLYSVSAYSAIMGRGERVVAVSETVKEYILTNYPEVPVEHIRLIYRGVDPTEFPLGYQPDEAWLADWHRSYPQLRGRRVLTLPGRLTRLKGQQEFIDLIGRLRRQRDDVVGLLVGGEDPRRQSYARELHLQAQRLGLGDRLIFAGHRSDMREIYAVSDLVLSLSSRRESFGRTVLEALALGRPVVGYDHGGVAEILAALYPSGRVSPMDAEALYRRVSDLLEQPVAPRPNTLFIKSRMLEQTLELYRELTA